jgi:predicted nuclease with TOPRIM domain
MTFVGKILVFAITILAVIFLGLSTVVFSTAKNWREEASAQKKKVSELQGQIGQLDGTVKAAEKQLADEADQHKQQAQQLQGRIDALTKDIEARQAELTQQRETVAKAQESMRGALREAEARKAETDQLRQQLGAVQQQANDFKIRQTELDDEIRILNRQLETATSNNKALRDRVSVLSNVVRDAGLTDAAQQASGTNRVPPDVEGQVLRVDRNNSRVEISIGSDDGLSVGHELELWRTTPAPDYLGRIRIDAVDPDRAVGSVIGKTIQGKKIQEGDIVSSQIRPRS